MELPDTTQNQNSPRRGTPPFSGGRKPQRAEQRTEPRPQIKWRAPVDADEEDAYFIPPEVIPEGMSWQWKRYSSMGKDDIEHQMRLTRNGAWDPVPNKMWSEKLGTFAKGPDEPIIVGGQMLMQRPMAYTEAAEAKELRKANDRVTNQFKSLSLSDGPVKRAKASIKSDYSTIQLVPADEDASES